MDNRQGKLVIEERWRNIGKEEHERRGRENNERRGDKEVMEKKIRKANGAGETKSERGNRKARRTREESG